MKREDNQFYRNFYRRNSRKSSDDLRKIIEQRQALVATITNKKQAYPLTSEIEASKQILIDRGEMEPEEK